MKSSTDAICRRAQAGDPSAFAELYGMYAKELYAYACAILKDTQDAQDIVQETCLKVYTHINCVQSPERCKAYFFRVLSNTARTYLRRKSLTTIHTEFFENLSAPEDTAGIASARADLQAALAALSDEERQIVLLSAVAGLRSREIAEIVGLTAGSVRAKLSRALQKMRGYLAVREEHPNET